MDDILSLILFLGLLGWVFFWTIYSARWFTDQHDYLNNELYQQDKKYQGFARRDFNKWSFVEFYLTGLFLLPIRITLIVLSIILMFLLIKPLSLCFLRPPEQPMNRFFKFYSNLITRIICRMILLIGGFYWIHKKKVHFDEEKYPKLRLAGSLEDCTLVIANHVSVWDVFVQASYGNRGFIAKHTIKSRPIIGFIATQAQSYFVDRFDKDSRNKTVDFIKNRIEGIQRGESYNKLVIFPEGTTSNGYAIVSLKLGCFMQNVPLRVMGMKYSGTFDANMNMMPEFRTLIGTLCNFTNGIKVFETDGLLGYY